MAFLLACAIIKQEVTRLSSVGSSSGDAPGRSGSGGCPARAWGLILLAAAFEIGWAGVLPMTEGFTRLLPSGLAFLLMVGAFLPLAAAVRTLPIGTAYAVWTGLGAVGTSAVGILAWSESTDPLRLASIALIICGVAGLKLLDQRGGGR